MTGSEVLQYTANGLMIVLILSMPPILVASIVGTLFSLFQALTQIQEQTLSFTVKLVAISITLFLTARWLGMEIYNFGQVVFDIIPSLGN
jgi:type III secretion protein S